jgi:hypothetical protein
MISLSGWVPSALIPNECLDTKIDNENYCIHYNSSHEKQAWNAQTICDKYLVPIINNHNLDKVHIYLYLINYLHNYDKPLTRENCNNGYTVSYPNKFYIVVFRRLFWQKVLIHEILHVLWISSSIPIPRSSPKYDESFIEKIAVRNASRDGYLDIDHYTRYLEESKNTLLNIYGGTNEIISNQKTPVYEYLFYDKVILDVIKLRQQAS